MKQMEFLCVDYQYDFAGERGAYSVIGESPLFIKTTLIPFLRERGIKVHEIISDYRLPRGNSRSESCVPGSVGFSSLLPEDMRNGNAHIKCMHNPIWTRDGIGEIGSVLEKEHQSPDLFNQWISLHLYDKKKPVILFGETMDCCILNVAQELYFRGYTIYVLYEATDPMPDRQEYKDFIAYHSSLSIYAQVITFAEIIDIV